MMFAIISVFTFTNNAMASDPAPAEGEEAAPVIQFVELPPLIIPVINDRGVTQMVSLVVAVEVNSQEKADQVTKYAPKLTDAYLSDLYGAFSRKAPEGGMVPIAYLKQRLNKMSAKVLGEGVIDDVLLQVLQRRAT